MKRIVTMTVLALGAFALFAQSETPAAAPVMPRDENIELVASDLHALDRIASLSREVNDSRQLMLAILDSDIEMLRMKRDDGTYRWASLQREDGGQIKDEKTIEQVYTEKELRKVIVTGDRGFRVVVSVPAKRGVFAANNRIWVRNVLADITSFDGKVTHHEIPVNAWVNPGDANGVALPEIGKSVQAIAELGVESGSKRAVAEVALVQAKLVDDPASPYFPAVKRLLQIRELSAAKDINRGYLKNSIDEAKLSLPGEFEKRAAEQLAAAEERKRLALAGEAKGSIALGDATPDVVLELSEVSRMMNGTLQEQTDARTRLQTLLDSLKPPTITSPNPESTASNPPNQN